MNINPIISEIQNFYSKKIPVLKTFKKISDKQLLKFLPDGMPIRYESIYRQYDLSEIVEKLHFCVGSRTNVRVRYGRFDDPFEYALNRKETLMAFQDFLENYFFVKQEVLHYMGNHTVSSSVLHKAGIIVPEFYDLTDFSDGLLWIGKTGCSTPLHCDGGDNIIYQLYGTKKWTLFPPSDFDKLYVNLDFGFPKADFLCSEIDVLNPNYEKYPLFQFAQPLELTLNAGEALYLPYGWFHHIETTNDSIMINFRLMNSSLSPAIFS